MKKAVILVSGGLDSATTLAIARDKQFECYAISVYYGQKHASELNAAQKISVMLGAVEHKIVNINLNDLGGSSLLDKELEVQNFKENKQNEIPNTYVPARNTTFLSIALGYAEIIGAHDIFIGACQLDYSGYPDCREKYLNAFETLANLATKAGVEGKKFRIHAPLLNLTKAETIRLGIKLGVDYSQTISCYKANEQGLACGACDSCTYRKKGFKEAGIKDQTPYAE